MSPTLLPHPVAELGLLADLDTQEAVLFARKAQALVDYEAACRRQSTQGRAVEFIALDLAVTCGIAQSTATQRLAVARHLVLDLPGTHHLLAEGLLHVGEGLAVLEETKGLSAELCARLEAAVLGQLVDTSTGDTRRLVKKTLIALDAEAGELRRRQQHKERRVFLTPKPDGRAFVGIHGSAEAATGFWHELSLLARLTFGTQDPRTLDQQRADLAWHYPGSP